MAQAPNADYDHACDLLQLSMEHWRAARDNALKSALSIIEAHTRGSLNAIGQIRAEVDADVASVLIRALARGRSLTDGSIRADLWRSDRRACDRSVPAGGQRRVRAGHLPGADERAERGGRP